MKKSLKVVLPLLIRIFTWVVSINATELVNKKSDLKFNALLEEVCKGNKNNEVVEYESDKEVSNLFKDETETFYENGDIESIINY